MKLKSHALWTFFKINHWVAFKQFKVLNERDIKERFVFI